MSFLPDENTPWPPKADAERYRRMRPCDAWYSGDPNRIAAQTTEVTETRRGGVRTTLNPGGTVASTQRTGQDRFWAQNPGAELDTRRHLPVAQDIATISSELLFANEPTVVIDGPMDDAGQPTPEVRAAQQRIEYVLRKCNWHALLLAAAEIAAALGSTGLRIAFDKGGPVNDRPVLTRVDADALLPRYSWGQLTGVIFWHVLRVERDEVWRHLEAHQGGKVLHAVYKGTADRIGERIPVSSMSATAHLTTDPTLTIVEVTLDSRGGATAVSIPNMLPDPLDRSSHAGRSDYTVPVQGLFDDIDRVYSQMIESIDDAKSRILIDDSLLTKGQPGEGVNFDMNQRLFTRLKMPPVDEMKVSGLPIDKVEFEMRIEEYLQGLDSLITKAIEACGYTADVEHDDRGAAMTATEYLGRNRRSLSTREKKIGYWQAELGNLLTTLLRVDVEHFAPIELIEGKAVRVQPFPVSVEFAPSVQPTLLDLANTAKTLRDARVASIFTAVKLVHPEWGDKEAQDEVDRILREESVPDPITFGSSGDGVTPEESMLKGGMSVEDARTALDALGVGVRAGADAAEVADIVGLAGLKMTGATPASLRLPEADAAKLEDK